MTTEQHWSRTHAGLLTLAALAAADRDAGQELQTRATLILRDTLAGLPPGHQHDAHALLAWPMGLDHERGLSAAQRIVDALKEQA